jgi:hypothetical protein
MNRPPRLSDTFRWRLAIGAAFIAGGYLAWLIIPLVVASDLNPSAKTALAAFLGCNAAADQTHCNCATRSTDDRFLKEAFFQTVPPRFGHR